MGEKKRFSKLHCDNVPLYIKLKMDDKVMTVRPTPCKVKPCTQATHEILMYLHAGCILLKGHYNVIILSTIEGGVHTV